MLPARERLVFEILEEALEQPPGERLRWVERCCQGDPDLRDAVLALVAAARASEGFLEVKRRRPRP